MYVFIFWCKIPLVLPQKARIYHFLAQILKIGQKWAKMVQIPSDNHKFWPSEAKLAGFDTRLSKYAYKTPIKDEIKS